MMRRDRDRDREAQRGWVKAGHKHMERRVEREESQRQRRSREGKKGQRTEMQFQKAVVRRETALVSGRVQRATTLSQTLQTLEL